MASAGNLGRLRQAVYLKATMMLQTAVGPEEEGGWEAGWKTPPKEGNEGERRPLSGDAAPATWRKIGRP